MWYAITKALCTSSGIGETTVTLERVSYASQTIAALAVIASLVFVGAQIRQNERTQRAVMHDNRLRQIRETSLHIASPGVTARAE